MSIHRLGLAALAAGFLCSASQAFTLTGTIRDFKRGDLPGGHPDFETYLTGHVTGMVGTMLNAAGNPVYVGTAPYGGVTSAATFDQWFNDVPGVNLSTSHSITLAPVSGGWEYSSSAFFPIDGMLWGNEGLSHNYHFTYELAATFKYEAGTGQTFDFTGDDDVWVFFNNKLAIDLGGVHGAVSGSVNLDTIAGSHGFTDGQTYTMKFFFAERHTIASNFRMKTNFDLTSVPESVPEPFTMALGLAGAGVAVRRIAKRRRTLA